MVWNVKKGTGIFVHELEETGREDEEGGGKEYVLILESRVR